MPHVGNRPAAELVPAAKDRVRVVRMIGPRQRRSQPQVPVEVLRHGRRIGRDRRVLRPYRPVRPVVNLAQGADGALPDPAGHLANPWIDAGRHEIGADLGLAGGLDDQSGFLQPIRQRLVHCDVLALSHRCNRNGRVEMIRRHHLDRIQVLLLFQQLTKVGIRGTALELARSPPLGIAGLDDGLANVPSSGNAAGFPRVGFAQRPGDRPPQAVARPVHVVDAVLLRIAHGDHLQVRRPDPAHEMPQSHGPATNEADVDLLAWGDMPRPAQHVARHNRKGGRRSSRATEEFASVHLCLHGYRRSTRSWHQAPGIRGDWHPSAVRWPQPRIHPYAVRFEDRRSARVPRCTDFRLPERQRPCS